MTTKKEMTTKKDMKWKNRMSSGTRDYLAPVQVSIITVSIYKLTTVLRI